MKELYDRLPDGVKRHLDMLRKDYANAYRTKDEVRAEIRGYAKGLRDAGIVTDYERGMLCIYCFN